VPPVEPAEEAYVEPLKAAFDQGELGEPLDWNALSEPDRAFLDALMDQNAVEAKEAIAAGANPNLNCGHGCTSLMLAAATGDKDLVATVKEAGAQETPEAAPYLEILGFPENAERPEFRAALADIEKLAGRKPVPAERPGQYRLELGAEAAKAFLDEHHERLLGKGCYVFLYDQNFGIGGKPDVLCILPTNDKYAVMAYTGVNGVNYDIDTHLVIRWMRRLEEGHPYVLTGCGFDFLSGRFKDRLSDPASMAERMYQFCPDIVDQGTGSVEYLAKELERTNALYFWWD
jgi:hypothetical protein